MPRSTAREIRSAGYDAEDVRDVGLRSQPDEVIAQYAATHGRAIITADLGFGNPLRFPQESHAGIIISRIPDVLPSRIINREILRVMTELADLDLADHVVIEELGRFRVRGS